jgi:uncharacterized protein
MLANSFSPVQKLERIQLLDVLRGFAILGIFIMNLEGFTFHWALSDVQKAQLPLAQYDHTTSFLQNMLLEGKFYSLFSMLFGIGFAIYLSKANEDNNVIPLFRRRLAVLLLIGFMHLLLWTGDIVMFYAMLGFLLIPFRKFSNKTLLIIAGLCILSPIAWYALKMSNPKVFNLAQWFYKLGDKQSLQFGITSNETAYRELSGGDFIKLIKMNFVAILYRYGDLIFQSRAFKVFGMFLIGLVIGRTQLYYRLQEKKALLWKIFLGGLILGIPANFIYATLHETRGYGELTPHGLKQTTAYAFGVAPMALAYAAGIALIYISASGRRILNALAPVGKMALSNYIMHTLIGIFVFTRLGIFHAPIGPTQWTMFALGVYVIQVFTSAIWLQFFNYGPLEWLWRSATYKKWQPMLRYKRT